MSTSSYRKPSSSRLVAVFLIRKVAGSPTRSEETCHAQSRFLWNTLKVHVDFQLLMMSVHHGLWEDNSGQVHGYFALSNILLCWCQFKKNSSMQIYALVPLEQSVAHIFKGINELYIQDWLFRPQGEDWHSSRKFPTCIHFSVRPSKTTYVTFSRRMASVLRSMKGRRFCGVDRCGVL